MAAEGYRVVAVDFVQALRLFDRHERGVRNHFPLIVLDEHILEILGVPPELRHRLNEDLVELAEPNKALLPGAADEDGEIVHRFSDRHTLLHGHIVVDDHFVLRIVAGKKCEQALYFFAFCQRGHELVGHLSEPLVVGRVCLIQHTCGEAAGGTKAWNGGRFKELEFHIRHLATVMLELLNDLLGRQLAFGPGLQVDQAGSRVRTPALGQNLVTGQ